MYLNKRNSRQINSISTKNGWKSEFIRFDIKIEGT